MRLFFLCFVCLPFLLGAQSVVTGHISDAETGEPLIAATILEVGTENGVVTDFEGNFTLIPLKESGKLRISYTGYRNQTTDFMVGEEIKIALSFDEMTIISCPVIIRDSPVHLRLPAPYFKISPQLMQRDQDLTVLPALNRVPGIYIHSGALNTNRITLRGIGNRSPFSTTKIRAYLDDIPLTSGDGETTVEDLDPDLIRRITVWKGPAASIYGAGLGGMLHLQTANVTNGSNTLLKTRFSAGSYGLLRSSTTLNVQPDQKFNLRLNYNRTHSDGYRANNTYDREGAFLLLKFKPVYRHETTLLTNLTRVKAFIPSSLNRTDYENNPAAAAPNWAAVNGNEDYQKAQIGLAHRMILAENVGTYEFGNKTALFTSARDNAEARPFNFLSEESRVFGARTSFYLHENGTADDPFPTWSAGAEYFYEDYDWQTCSPNDGQPGGILLSDNAETRSYLNLFAQYHGNLTDRLALLAGLNFNQTRYDYDDLFLADGSDESGSYTFDGTLSPRVGLTWYPDFRRSVFGTISHGFSPPTVSETLTPSGTINPDIQPEQGWNFEAGSRGRFQSGRLQYEVSLYTMLIKDLLVARRTAEDQFVGLNAGKTRHTGAEAYLFYEIVRRRGHLLSAWSTYTFSDYKFLDFKDGDNDYSGNELTGTAPHHLNVGLDYEHRGGIYGNVNFKYLSAFPIRDDNSIYSEPYSLLNTKIGWRSGTGRHWQWDIFGGLNNVLNTDYASSVLINAGSFGGNAPRYYYPGLPLHWFAGAELSYRF